MHHLKCIAAQRSSINISEEFMKRNVPDFSCQQSTNYFNKTREHVWVLHVWLGLIHSMFFIYLPSFALKKHLSTAMECSSWHCAPCTLSCSFSAHTDSSTWNARGRWFTANPALKIRWWQFTLIANWKGVLQLSMKNILSSQVWMSCKAKQTQIRTEIYDPHQWL